MPKPSPDELNAMPAAAGAVPTVTRAEPGQPWPEPTSSGRWSRDPATGDLTQVEPATQPPTEQERRARRDKQREAALKADKTNLKE